MASRTQARLRKTFQYPDSDDDDTPEALDEEALTSLIASAWVMYAFPVGRTGWGIVDAWAAGAATTGGGKDRKGKGRAVDIAPGEQEGPLRRWLVPLNACLAGVIIVAGVLGTGGGGVKLSVLPGLSLGVVVAAKVQMRGVEADVDELEGLRYGYKD
ncbi:hypothetical protein ACLOAV_008907 [Pseudogymnoascus australis]